MPAHPDEGRNEGLQVEGGRVSRCAELGGWAEAEHAIATNYNVGVLRVRDAEPPVDEDVARRAVHTHRSWPPALEHKAVLLHRKRCRRCRRRRNASERDEVRQRFAMLAFPKVTVRQAAYYVNVGAAATRCCRCCRRAAAVLLLVLAM